MCISWVDCNFPPFSINISATDGTASIAAGIQSVGGGGGAKLNGRQVTEGGRREKELRECGKKKRGEEIKQQKER